VTCSAPSCTLAGGDTDGNEGIGQADRTGDCNGPTSAGDRGYLNNPTGLDLYPPNSVLTRSRATTGAVTP